MSPSFWALFLGGLVVLCHATTALGDRRLLPFSWRFFPQRNSDISTLSERMRSVHHTESAAQTCVKLRIPASIAPRSMSPLSFQLFSFDFDNFETGFKGKVLVRPDHDAVHVKDLGCLPNGCVGSCFSSSRYVKNADDMDYQDAAMIWNNAYRGSSPPVILIPQNTASVAAAIKFMRMYGLSPTIKSGGHSLEGFCQSNDKWLIYMKNLNSIEIDHDTGVATIGPAITNEELYAATNGTDWLFVSGSNKPTGVGGLILGGGLSIISRSYGTASDNVLEFEVVLANGDVVRASHYQNSDLFWALRGAGHANFGIVTRIKVQMRRASKKRPFGKITWYLPSKSFAKKVITKLDEFISSPSTPNEMSCKLVYSRSFVMYMTWFYNKDDEGEAKALIRTFLKGLWRPAPKRTEFRVGEMSEYQEMVDFKPYNQPLSIKHLTKSFMVNKITKEVLDALIMQFSRPSTLWDKASSTLAITSLGGKYSEIDEYFSAYSHRSALFSVEVIVDWVGANEEQSRKLEGLWTSLREEVVKIAKRDGSYVGAYPNYPDQCLGTNYWAEYYGEEKWRMLKTIKIDYDPDNFFQWEQGIPVNSPAVDNPSDRSRRRSNILNKIPSYESTLSSNNDWRDSDSIGTKQSSQASSSSNNGLGRGKNNAGSHSWTGRSLHPSMLRDQRYLPVELFETEVPSFDRSQWFDFNVERERRRRYTLDMRKAVERSKGLSKDFGRSRSKPIDIPKIGHRASSQVFAMTAANKKSAASDSVAAQPRPWSIANHGGIKVKTEGGP